MPKAARLICMRALAVAAVVALLGPAAARAEPDLRISTNTSQFLPWNRVVLSTVNEEARPPARIRFENVGTTSLRVEALTLGPSDEVVNGVPGREADYDRQNDFVFSGLPPFPFRIAPNRSVDIQVAFVPLRVSSKPDGRTVETVDGSSFATLTVESNDPNRRLTRIGLAGLNAADYRGSDEPSVAEIARAFGFTTDVGREKRRLGDTNKLVGEEVYSPNWVSVRTQDPVLLWPLALYGTPTAGTHDTTVIRGTSGNKCGRRVLYDFPGGNDAGGGENQKLLPRISVGGVAQVPNAPQIEQIIGCPFDLFHKGGNSDDDLNAGGTRNMRIFPVRSPQGEVVPNTWLVTSDPTPSTARAKNYDYQDGVFMLVGARPE